MRRVKVINLEPGESLAFLSDELGVIIHSARKPRYINLETEERGEELNVPEEETPCED